MDSKKVSYVSAGISVAVLIALVLVYLKAILPMAELSQTLASENLALKNKVADIESSIKSMKEEMTETKNTVVGMSEKIAIAIKDQKIVVVCKHNNVNPNGVIVDPKNNVTPPPPPQKTKKKRTKAAGDDDMDLDLDIDLDIDL